MAYATDFSDDTIDPVWTKVDVGDSFHWSVRFNAANTNLSAALHKLTDIPAGTFIQGVVVEVETVEGGTATIDIGDHTDADTAIDVDGWIDGANLNTASGQFATGAASTAEEYLGGKLYPATKHLTMTVNNALDTAVFQVYVFGRKLRPNPDITIGS